MKQAPYPDITREDLSGVLQVYPEIFTTSFTESAKRILGWTVFVIFTGYCLWKMGFLNFSRLLNGAGNLDKALGFMFPPASHGYFWEFCYAMMQTVAMAFLGTLLATVASVPLGFLGAKNVVRNRLVHFGLRRVFDIIRGVDALIWALVFVNVVGLGPFTGILAIAVSDSGTLSKLFSEAIESVNIKEVDGVRASGANALQTIRFGMIPQIFPVILSQMLYFFESNTRSATILGVVGAGGIGLELSDRIRLCAWDEAMFIIIIILVAISIIDTLSKIIRLRVIGNTQKEK